MEPIRSKNELLRIIAASGLFTEDQFKAARFSTPTDASPREVSRELIALGWLTEWQADHLLAGRTAFQVGGYTLLDYLGRGRMGLVFRAEHRFTGRTVAVKIMAKELLGDKRSVKRFLREIHLVSRTSHPNVVAAYDAGVLKDGRYYLVTEFVPGRDLAKWLQSAETLPVAWACECAYQACLGLQHVAEKGLVHRDIKPSNIVTTAESLTEKPKAKILDLGLGRFQSSDAEEGQLTRDGYTLGTFEFASPEQIRNARRVDIRADIYSLGTTLFQLLTGRLPYVQENLADKLTAKFLEDAPSVLSLRNDVPRELSKVVAWMLEREPEKRPAEPMEAAKELSPFTMQPDSDVVVEANPHRTTRHSVDGVAKGGDGSTVAVGLHPRRNTPLKRNGIFGTNEKMTGLAKSFEHQGESGDQCD